MASLSESQVAELTAFASELADAARAEIMPYWRKRGLAVEDKMEPGRPAPESPVTVADRNAEAAMRKLIQERYPSHGVLGEEFGSERADAELCWVLDPIDGTKSFITGEHNTSVSRPSLLRRLIPLLVEAVPVRVDPHARWMTVARGDPRRRCPSWWARSRSSLPHQGSLSSSSTATSCVCHGDFHFQLRRCPATPAAAGRPLALPDLCPTIAPLAALFPHGHVDLIPSIRAVRPRYF